MTTRFLLKLVGGVFYATACFGVPLFLGAWTFDWPRAWIFLGVVFAFATIVMFALFPSRPDLLDERYKPPVQAGQPVADRVLVLLLLASFFGLLVFIALDVFVSPARQRWEKWNRIIERQRRGIVLTQTLQPR